MPSLGKFRQYDEHDVINLFGFSGNFPVSKGTFVKVGGSGFVPGRRLGMIGSPGASFANTVSQRWGNPYSVVACTSSGDNTIGMLLYDGKEVDENGNKLIFNAQKAAELEVFVSGQTAPVVRKGIFYYSGINGAGANAGAITPGAGAFLGIDGGLNTSGSLLGNNPQCTKVGQFLSARDDNGFALVRIDI